MQTVQAKHGEAAPAKAQAFLSVNNIEVVYSHVILVLKGVSLEVPKGGIVALLGANGAGKTTTLKAVTGIQPIAMGDVTYLGESIKGKGAWDLAKKGLVMIPEGRGTFTRMTITENLQMGAYIRNDGEIDADIDKVFTTFPRLKERATQLAGTMSGGEQQMLAIARALVTNPKLLLLDEPTDNLDLESAESLEQALDAFEGTVLAVTHDRWFARNMDRFLVFTGEGGVIESDEPVWDVSRR